MGNYFRPGTYALVPNKHLLPKMKGAPLSVYVTLCSHMDDQGICFPGVARIMDMTGYSRPVVFRALKVLIDLGVIERHNRFSKDSGQDSNLYRMLIADYPQPGVADDTGGSRTRYGGGVADDTAPSVVHDTLRDPSELNQLRNKNGVDKAQKQPPVSPATIDKVREQLAAKGIVKPKHNDDIVRHSSVDALKGKAHKDAGMTEKPVKTAGNGLKRVSKAPVTARQLANVRT